MFVTPPQQRVIHGFYCLARAQVHSRDIGAAWKAKHHTSESPGREVPGLGFKGCTAEKSVPSWKGSEPEQEVGRAEGQFAVTAQPLKAKRSCHTSRFFESYSRTVVAFRDFRA